jgi:hypothetical protein
MKFHIKISLLLNIVIQRTAVPMWLVSVGLVNNIYLIFRRFHNAVYSHAL